MSPRLEERSPDNSSRPALHLLKKGRAVFGISASGLRDQPRRGVLQNGEEVSHPGQAGMVSIRKARQARTQAVLAAGVMPASVPL